MSDFAKLDKVIAQMQAIKSMLEGNQRKLNKETIEVRHEDAKQVIEYLEKTRYALIIEKKKREREALTYEEKIKLWMNRAQVAGYDARNSASEYEPFTF